MNLENIKKFIITHKVDLAFLLFCVVLACLFTLNARLLSLSYGFLDPSFNYAVTEAGAQKLAFGTEFIATYGPLGFLIANYLPDRLIYANIWLLFHALLTAAGTFIFCRHYIRSRKLRWVVAVTVLYTLNICSRGGFVEWAYLGGFLLFCFIYLKLAVDKRTYLALLLAFLAIIFSLTKFTLGFGAIMTLLILIAVAPKGSRQQRLVLLGGVLSAYLAGLFILGKYLGITSLVDYIKTAQVISSNFSSAMSFYDPQTAAATVAVFVALASLVLWIVWREKLQAYRYLFLAPTLFVVWKYCVVRQDGHIMALLSTVIPIATLYFFVRHARKTSDALVLVFIIVTACTAVWANKIAFYGYDGFASMVTTPVSRIVTADFIDFAAMGRQKAQWAEKSSLQLGGAGLPASMKNRIGDSGVDIFPWETVIIAANDLRWQNRPMPFSFNAYDPSLDDANAAFLDSDQRAPKYIVWHNTGIRSIDFRNLLWDEPRTFRHILKNYKLVESSPTFMLLERRATPLRIQEKPISVKVGNGDWIRLPQTKPGLLMLSFQLHENIGNKLEAAVIREPAHFVLVKSQQNRLDTYRFIKENTGQGMLVNNLPITWDELVLLVGDHEVRDSQVREINIRGIDPASMKLKLTTFAEQ